MELSAPIDRYLWRAHLLDGSVIAETEADGTEHGWADVPAEQVVALELTPLGDGCRPVWLDVPEGATAGLGRRRSIALAADGTQTYAGTLTFLHWTRGEVQTWLYVTDDGTVSVLYQELD